MENHNFVCFQRQLDEILFPLNAESGYLEKLEALPMRPRRADFLMPFGVMFAMGLWHSQAVLDPNYTGSSENPRCWYYDFWWRRFGCCVGR